MEEGRNYYRYGGAHVYPPQVIENILKYLKLSPNLIDKVFLNEIIRTLASSQYEEQMNDMLRVKVVPKRMVCKADTRKTYFHIQGN